jgi:hypothetical protein
MRSAVKQFSNLHTTMIMALKNKLLLVLLLFNVIGLSLQQGKEKFFIHFFH